MRPLIIFYFFIFQFFLSSNYLEAQADILEKLQAIADVEVTEITPNTGFNRTFQIDVIQPVDHNNINGQTFTQRIYLNHNNESDPMVLLLSGYSVSPRSIQEAAQIYKTNHIAITRRYMGGSIPDTVDWQYLTIEQSAADHHHIVSLFKQIYTGVWISSGRSLSGLTALCHRRFYPDDVTGTIAYASPLMFEEADPRFTQFLNEAGTETSRNTIKQFQRDVLENRNEILPLFIQHLDGLGFGYSLGADVILEYLVLEYPFYFWAFGDGSTLDIPSSNASPAQLLAALLDVVDPFEYTDYGHEYFKSVYYQLSTEVGYYPLITDHLEDLLASVPNPSHKIFAPNHESISFNPAVMQDINSWLQTDGNNIIYLYGGQDPWTAAAVELNGLTNAVKIVQPGQNHFLKINDLDNPQIVFSTIEEWLCINDIETNLQMPNSLQLFQNYPNPFNPNTAIKYDLPKNAKVRLRVYDLLAQEIKTLVNEFQISGIKSVVWDGTDNTNKPVSAGLYIYTIQAGDNTQSKKMLYIK